MKRGNKHRENGRVEVEGNGDLWEEREVMECDEHNEDDRPGKSDSLHDGAAVGKKIQMTSIVRKTP